MVRKRIKTLPYCQAKKLPKALQAAIRKRMNVK